MPVAEQRGGAELMLRQLVQHAGPSKVEWVVVFLEAGPMVEDFRDSGVTTFVINAGRLRQPHRILATGVQICRIAKHEKVAVILGWMTKGQIYGGIAAIMARVPAIWYQLGTAEPRDWLVRLATALPARGVITLSHASAEAQRRIRPDRPQRMVYPGVELGRFDPDGLPAPAALRAKLELPGDGPLIGIVCRLQRWKGAHVLIEAMGQLRASHPDAHCVVVGGPHDLEPEYVGELRRQVKGLDLDLHVTFTGLQSNVPEWMQSMDVVVHASDNEPFGIVVIEAMALGKPVIAGAHGGPREIITHGVDGLLVPYGDATSLAAALAQYIEEPQFAKRAGVAARHRAQDFSAARYAHSVVTAVLELCAGCEAAPQG